MTNATLNNPHRRYNPLIDEWVLLSPQRLQRPWQGGIETIAKSAPEYDKNCYLCPGNTRANSNSNANYEHTFVFDNDFAAILATNQNEVVNTESLLQTQAVSGKCRVICFSPKHNVSLAKMQPAEIRQVIDLWAEQITELGQKYCWVQVFENKGAIMGCSNPHPHGQIWASDFIPTQPKKEDAMQRQFFAKHQANLLLDYLHTELQQQERIVVVNEHWLVVVPFWAIWPYETLLLPRFHVTRLSDLRSDERNSLALIMRELLQKYNKLFNVDFPYSMGWHGQPEHKADYSHWLLHAHYYPPLLRSANVKKFMVGYEMLAEAQRDITPEDAAAHLRDLE